MGALTEYLAPGSLEELHERTSEPPRPVIELLAQTEGPVVVAGAGGKMGLHLCRMLQRGFAEADRPERVVAVSRFSDAASRKWFDRFGIETLSADLLEDGALEILPDAPNVFFLAGIKFGTSDDVETLRRFNVEMPERFAQRYKNSRIVALSTGCVYPYAKVDSGGSTEEDPVGPVGAYAESCLGREQAFVESGARCTLIRLNYSVDLRYGVLVDLAQKVLARKKIDLETGYLNAIWQGDATAYIIQSLQLAAVPPAILNVTGMRTLSVRDVAEIMGELAEKKPRFRGLEADTAWLSNAARCHDLFGPPRVSAHRLIEWAVEWVAGGGETLGKPTHFETRDGKF